MAMRHLTTHPSLPLRGGSGTPFQFNIAPPNLVDERTVIERPTIDKPAPDNSVAYVLSVTVLSRFDVSTS
jgi:hypothetical protein